jgi:hypothetical protein
MAEIDSETEIPRVRGIVYPSSSFYPYGSWIVEDCPYCHRSHAYSRTTHELSQMLRTAHCRKGQFIITW